MQEMTTYTAGRVLMVREGGIKQINMYEELRGTEGYRKTYMQERIG